MPDHGQTVRCPFSETKSTTNGLGEVERRRNDRIKCGFDYLEPSLEEMVCDPVFLQLITSDGVSMNTFMDLVTAVRRRLGN